MDHPPPDPSAPHPGSNIESGLKTLATALGLVGAAISAMIGWNTIRSSQDQLSIASQQRCVDFTTNYINAITKAATEDSSGQAESIRAANYQYLAFNHDLRQAICHKAGFDEDFGLPPKDQLRQIADPASVEQTAAAPSAPAPAVTAPSPNGGTPPPAPPLRPVVAAAPALRLFIQIHDADQRIAATALQQILEAQNVAGHPITVPGIELVPTATQSSLRCLKAADCTLNAALAAAIAGHLSAPGLKLLDLSFRYENSPNIRPGSYELWFGPGPITLRP